MIASFRSASPLAISLALVCPAVAGAAEPDPQIPPAPARPPVRAEFVQYGAAFTVLATLAPGDTCPSAPGARPCILGSGGGILLRGGFRAQDHWYLGGAYEFTKMDSSNLYRLGIFQQLRAEGRYYFETGGRLVPFLPASLGAVGYGSEWGIEVVGATASLGGGLEVEFSRHAVVSLSVQYRPVLLSAWRDTAGQERPVGLAHLLSFELSLDVRSDLPRR